MLDKHTILWTLLISLLFVTAGIAQNHEVSGTVTDAETGETLPGVNISVQGTTQGTTSDMDGNYTLSSISGDVVLVFSYVGYESLEVAVDGRQIINIQLSSLTLLGDELVVVGYGVQEKINLTGSVGVVSSRDIENRPIASVEEALQGAVSGLNIVRTGGQPGNQQIDIKIRGTSTFTENPPLVIVDGVPSSIDRLNSNDIESISVLKDAASTAIYGTRATGGVILVTTKSGQSGAPRFNYRSTTSLQQPTRWAEKVSAFEFAQMHNLASVNDGVSPIFSESDLDRFSSADWSEHDWDDYILNNAIQTNQNVSISGGSESHTYYLSVGYLYQDGTVNNSNYEKFNIQLNQELKIGNRFTFDVRGAYSPSKIIEPAYSWNELRFIHGAPKAYPFKSEDGKWLNTPGRPAGLNAMANLSEDGGQATINESRLSGNFNAVYNMFDNVNITGTYGIVTTNSRDRNYRNLLTVYDTDNNAYESDDNYLDLDTSQETLQSINLLANYSTSIKSHDISVLAGVTREWFEGKNNHIGTRDFLTDNIFVVDAGSSDPALWTIGGSAADWALQSLISRVNYTFRDKYLLEGSMRYDGSSRFSEENRWGFFPSISAGWIISDEKFIQNNNTLTYLKLRGSWGQVGNQNVGFYPFVNRLAESAYFFNGSPQRAVATAGAANPLLTWETKEAFNIGLEGSFYDNLLEFQIDLFHEKTDDILLQLPLPTTFGQPEPVQNAGRVDNKGWELELGHRNTIEGVSYGISFQVSNATNEVINMGGISPRISGDTITEEGHPMNEWYGLEADGFFQNEAEVENHAFQDAQTSAGDIRYKDQNNDGIINSNDRVRLGRSDPRFPFGIKLNINYKNFDFSAFGQGKMKHKVISRPWEPSGPVDTYRTYHRDYWTPENPNASFPQPRIGAGPLVGINKEFSSFWLEDAAYFRLKHVELGYNLPYDIVEMISLRNARIFISAENLFTITNYLGYDPELATGLERRQIQSRYPISKLFNVGINVNF